MTDKLVQRIREAFEQRSEALNELHFVYQRLLRMLPRIAGRSDLPLRTLLQQQIEEDKMVHHEMVLSAVEHGHVPGPCVCEEAAALTNELHLAARIPSRLQRANAVVEALRGLRIFLIRTWGRLLDTLPDDVLPAFRSASATWQHREADQHRQLVVFGEDLRQDDDLEKRAG